MKREMLLSMALLLFSALIPAQRGSVETISVASSFQQNGIYFTGWQVGDIVLSTNEGFIPQYLRHSILNTIPTVETQGFFVAQKGDQIEIKTDISFLPAKAVLITINGSKVKEYSIEDATTHLTIPSPQQGVYLLEIEHNKGRFLQKLISY